MSSSEGPDHEALRQRGETPMTPPPGGGDGDEPRAGQEAAELQARALREYQEDLRRAQTMACLGFWQIDLDRRKMRGSDEAKRIYGIEGDECGLTQVQQIPLPAYRSALDEALRRLITEGTPYSIEFEIRRASDGALRYVHSIAEYDAQRQLVRGTIQDITDRRQNEAALARHARRQRIVTEILQYRSDDLQDFLDHCLKGALELTESRYGYIYFYDESRREFVLNSWSKDVMASCKVVDPQTCYELDKTGIWGEAVRQRQPIVVNDFAAHHPLKKGYPEGHVPLARFLTIPVFQGDEIVAVVGVANKAAEYDAVDTAELTMLMDAVWKSVGAKRSEFALRDHERYLRSIIQATIDGFWVVGEGGRIVDVNDAYCAMSGYTREEARNLCIADLDAIETPEDTARRKARIMEKGSESFQTRQRRKDGSIFPVEVSATYLPDQGGRIICFARDITEHLRAEEALRESEERWRNVLVHTPQIGVSLDPEGRIIFANEALLNLTGWQEEEVLGRDWFDTFVPEEIRDDVGHVFRESVASGNALGYSSYENEILTRSGERRTVAWSNAVSRDQRGNTVAITCLGVDLTERQRAEARQEDLRNQLAQVQKMESIGRLAGGVAHDSNNMLGVILGWIEVLLDDFPEDQDLRHGLLAIQSAARRSADLTSQLLAFARKQTVAPKAVDLRETIPALLSMLRRLVGENVECRFEPSPGELVTKIDPAQLDQILTNLVVNARDAIVRSDGLIVIRAEPCRFEEDDPGLEPDMASGDYVQLSVVDNGCGMDETTRVQAFEPFFTTKGVGEGTGLGLSTVYGIVKQNQGFVRVESAPGRGATVRVLLPAHAAAAGAAAAEHTKLSFGTGERVLLVEDEPSLLKLSATMVRRLGYQVLTASSPEEALRVVRDRGEDIDLLLTDVVMPGMDGSELARQFRAMLPGLKCVFMSGYTADAIARHGVLDPGVDFVQKPFTLMSLGEALRGALSPPEGE